MLTMQKLVGHCVAEHEAKSVDISPNGQLCAVGLGNGEFLLLELGGAGLREAGRRRDRSQPVQCVRWVVREGEERREGMEGKGGGREGKGGEGAVSSPGFQVQREAWTLTVEPPNKGHPE